MSQGYFNCGFYALHCLDPLILSKVRHKKQAVLAATFFPLLYRLSLQIYNLFLCILELVPVEPPSAAADLMPPPMPPPDFDAPAAPSSLSTIDGHEPGHSRNNSNTSQMSKASGYSSLSQSQHSRQSSSGDSGHTR